MPKGNGLAQSLDGVENGMNIQVLPGMEIQQVLDLFQEFGLPATDKGGAYVASPVTRQQLEALGEQRYTDFSGRLLAIAKVFPIEPGTKKGAPGPKRVNLAQSLSENEREIRDEYRDA